MDWSNYTYCEDILQSKDHVLVVGSTGSGKSMLVQELIHSMLAHSDILMMLADPKSVELYPYSKLKSCIAYADTDEAIEKMMDRALNLMERRYAEMRAQGVREYTGASVFLIIDELADLMLAPNGKKIAQKLQKLLQKARASKIFVIACSQAPHKSVIPAMIQLNCNTKVALHCSTATESRLILGQAGAERLPKYGYGYIKNSNGIKLQQMACSTEQEKQERMRYWK